MITNRLLSQILFLYCNIFKSQIKETTNKSILFLATFSKYGGTRTYMEVLLDLLQEYEYQIYFIQNEDNINSNALTLIRKKNIIPIEFNYTFKTWFTILFSIYFFNKIIKKYNINTTIITEGDVGYYLPCILLKTQNVLIEHTIPMSSLDYLRNKIVSKIKSNTKLICVSEYQKNKTIENWGKNLKDYCSVIYNSSGFNSSLVFKKKMAFFSIRKIITVAHFIDYKNPDMWLSIANKLTQKRSGLEFRWIGDGEKLPFYQDKLKENNAIKLLGYCDKEQIKTEYENAFLYLALSKIENLPISVIDALYAGLPAVVLNTGGLPEVVDSGKCGFVVNNEEEAIERIEILLNDQGLYLDMCKYSVERYNALFSKSMWKKNIVNILPHPQ